MPDPIVEGLQKRDDIWMDSGIRREIELAEFQRLVASVFTPGQPIVDPSLFSGRSGLLSDLRSELDVAGMHFVLYGERGVGKTSLWQILGHHRRFKRHQASVGDDFVSIFLRVLEDLGEQFTEGERKRLAEVNSNFGVDKIASVGSKVGTEAVETPVAQRTFDMNFVLDRIAGHAKDLDAVVIDEFQNIRTTTVQTQIIEVVKGFSDRGVDVKILIVGVADSDDELLSSPEYAQYKGRHFHVRRVPRMTDDEVRDILKVRERRFRVVFEDEVTEGIVCIARGYPGTAHRLSLWAAQAWAKRAFAGFAASTVKALLKRWFSIDFVLSIEKAGVHVERQDLRRAVERFSHDFRENHKTAAACYDRAVASARREAVDQVILALASAPTTGVTANELAASVGMSREDLEALLTIYGSGCVESVDDTCRLMVRELGRFVEASRYLAA